MRLPAFPYFHFMAFAPLDCWVRLLSSGGAWRRIEPRYWPRLGLAIATSTLGTILTLPERALVGFWRAIQGRKVATAAPSKPIVFVLGYYRSGTTHLHYLLSCDPQLATPRWYQMLAPQGFVVSWTLLRYLLVPFLSSKRPQDDVAYGPEYPAEDDFGVCNMAAAGTMPGRMVLPKEWPHYARYQTLELLTPAERSRFERAQRAITDRLALVHPRRGLLLKSPAHTARVRALIDLYGADNVRFIHVHRDATAVLRSNVLMHRRFSPFLLQEAADDATVTQRVVAEYDQTQRALQSDLAALASKVRLASIRYEDLIADPVGELHRTYEQLGLPFSAAFAQRLCGYLDTVRDYRAKDERAKTDQARDDERVDVSPQQQLAWMHETYGHQHPPVLKRDPRERVRELLGSTEVPRLENQSPTGDTPFFSGQTAAIATAACCVSVWLMLSFVLGSRLDWLTWPTGVAIGLAALRSAGRGTFRLGIFAAVLTILVLAIVAYPATWISDYADRQPVPWDHVWLSTRRGVLATNNFVWVTLGVMSAYRMASRAHVRPPGL